MIHRMGHSPRRRAVAWVLTAAALLVALGHLQPDPTSSALARTGTINIGTRPPS